MAIALAASDDPLIELARRTSEAQALWLGADIAENDLLALYAERMPEPPEALFFQPLDWTFGLGAGRPRDDGRRWHGDPESVQLARSLMPIDAQPFLAPDPNKTARVSEIVAAYDQWVADCNRLGDELGVAAASDRTSELFDAYKVLMDELAVTPATTLAGILAKATFGAQLFGDEVPFEDPQPGHDVDRVAFSIVRDVVAMQGRA